MKKFIKPFIIKVLWAQVARLRARYQPIVIGVAGSVGKTSTKTAVAKVLEQKYKVAWQEGNYNDIVSIPMVFFGVKVPSLLNIFAWLWLFVKNELTISRGYEPEVVVLELGTDHSGDMLQLKGLLKLDHCLLTAISPEHMANFNDLDDVAKDELVVVDLSENVIVDCDSVQEKYRKSLKDPITISRKSGDCVIKPGGLDENGRQVEFVFEDKTYKYVTKSVGIHNLSSLAFAIIVARILELTDQQIDSAVNSISPVNGRMNLLPGKNGSVLIDDTYNSSPSAAIAALETLYEMKAKQKVAILGQMNEMGDSSKQYHEEVGEYCDPKKLKLVVTIGKDANEYLASKAEQNGCRVVRCSSPYHAGEIVLTMLNKKTATLIKGSQNGIFAEEATKILLEDQKDANKLVRQSDHWLKVKQKQFKDVV